LRTQLPISASLKRSAASSKEIRQLIGASSSQVASSVQKIHAAGVTINQIVSGIRDVAASVAQISTSSAEQSAGLSKITAAVRHLEEITQSNATMVEHAVDKAEDLESRATTLVDSVALFKLAQGSPEEAVALVNHAVAQRQRGTKSSFLREVTSPANDFYDRDMYVFALDARGTYLAFGGNAAKVGTRVQDIAGIDGSGLLQTIIDQAGYEPGWVEYDITNPTTGQVQTKMSYVLGVDDLWQKSLVQDVSCELLSQMFKQRGASLAQNYVAEPHSAGSFGLVQIPDKYAADEIDCTLFREEGGIQGSHQRTPPPFAADPYRVPLLCALPGRGGADLDAVAAVDAFIGSEHWFAVGTGAERPFGARLDAQAATYALLGTKFRPDGSLETDVVDGGFGAIEGTAGKTDLELVVPGDRAE